MHARDTMHLKRGLFLGLVASFAVACDGGSDGADESTAGTDSETAGPSMLDPACETADPDVDASFDVAVEGWETDGYGFYDIDADCLISTLEIEEGVWTTGLDCGDEKAPRTASLSMAAGSGETPDWAEGDEVRLQANHNRNEFGGMDWFELRRGEVLLAEGVIGGELDGALESVTARVGAALSYDECDAPMPGDIDADVGKLALHFERDSDSLVLISGHRGAFEVGDGRALAIDVEEAQSGQCCHGFHFFRVLKRRVIAQE